MHRPRLEAMRPTFCATAFLAGIFPSPRSCSWPSILLSQPASSILLSIPARIEDSSVCSSVVSSLLELQVSQRASFPAQKSCVLQQNALH